MTYKVKICGLTSKEAIDGVVKFGAEFAGFVFFEKSPRHLTTDKAKELLHYARNRILTVGVFVDPGDEYLAEILSAANLDIIQLHGHESIDRVKQVKENYPDKKIIKAFSVRNSDDIALAYPYQEYVDYFLFDARASESEIPGGNGISFDWNLLKHREFSVPWFLAGGINSYNVKDAIAKTGTKMIDVSSCVESSPGVKSLELIEEFISAVKD